MAKARGSADATDVTDVTEREAVGVTGKDIAVAQAGSQRQGPRDLAIQGSATRSGSHGAGLALDRKFPPVPPDGGAMICEPPKGE